MVALVSSCLKSWHDGSSRQFIIFLQVLLLAVKLVLLSPFLFNVPDSTGFILVLQSTQSFCLYDVGVCTVTDIDI
jgi:hypothetical protein